MSAIVTEIRKVRVLGPRVVLDRFLWVADLSADIVHTLAPDGAFMRNASLRVLAEAAETRPYQGWNSLSGEKDPGPLAFHDPSLLQVAVRPEPGRDPRVALLAQPDGSGAKAFSSGVQGQDPSAFSLFTAVPVDKWPDKQGAEIESPPLVLVGGGIDIAILKESGTDLWNALAVDNTGRLTTPNPKGGSDVYVSILAPAGKGHVYARSDGGGKRILARLTALGIELKALIDDPFATSGGSTGRTKATLRIEPDSPGDGLRIVLVAEEATAGVPTLRSRIERLLAGLRETGAPLALRIKDREVPLMWRLHETPPGATSRTYTIEGFFAPHLLPGSARVTLVTDAPSGGSIHSVAELLGPSVRIISDSSATNGRRIEISAGTPTPGARVHAAVDVSRDPGKPFEKLAHLYMAKDTDHGRSGRDEVPVAVDAAALRAALHARYVAAGLRRADSTEPLYAFLALERGVLQLPVPAPPANAPRSATAPTQAAFNGLVLVTVPSADAAVTLTVDSADYVFVQATFADFDCKEVAAQFSGAVGSFGGALWMSERSPSAQEVVPTLDTGPIALSSLAVGFGGTGPATWTGRMAPVHGAPPDRITLDVQPPPAGRSEVVHWAPRSRLALVAAMNMTRTGGNAAAPSQTRDLVPARYPLQAGGAAVSIALTPGVGPLPTATVTVGSTVTPQLGWPSWGIELATQGRDCRSVALVALTLPGVEYAPKTDQVGAQLLPSLRFDLPILGELFAPPVESRAASPTGPVAAPLVTALDLPGLERVWGDAARRLALTRTKQDRAIGWPPNDGQIVGLAEPFAWEVDFTVDVDASGLPLGAYQLGTRPPVGGEAALAGLSETFAVSGAALEPNSADSLKVTGFALAPYADNTLAGEEALTDTRGLVLGKVSTKLSNGLSIRRFRVLEGTTAAPAVRALVTTHQAVEIDLGPGRVAELWLRDLPMEANGSGWVFRPELLKDDQGEDAAHPEAALGPDPRAFDRRFLPEAVYEWRLFEGPAACVAAVPKSGSYVIAVDGLAWKPLRLHRLALDGAGQAAALTVIYSVGLSLPQNAGADAEPFGYDDAYGAGNTVAVTYIPKSGKLVATKVEKVEAQAPGLTVGGTPTLAFDFTAAIRLGAEPLSDPPRTQAARLSFEIEVTSGRVQPVATSGILELWLFGRRWSFRAMDVSMNPGQLTATWELPTSTVPPNLGLALSRVTVTLTEGGAASYPIEIEGHLSLDHLATPRNPAPVAIALRGDIHWFGATIKPDWGPAVIDHRRGVLRLHMEGATCTGEWLRGLPLDATAEALVAVAFEVDEKVIDAAKNPVVPVTAARVEIAASSAAAGAANVQIRYWMTIETPRSRTVPASRLTLSIDPAGSTRSRIGWPVGAIYKHLPSRDDFAGEQAGTRITLAPNAESLEHCITPHILDAELDPTLIEPDGGGGGWILRHPWRIKVFSEHRLSGPGATKIVRWTSLDDLTIVDLTALAADLSAAGQPPRRTYGYSPRYRHPVQGKTDKGSAAAMDVPGAGIVRVGEFGEVIGQVLVEAKPGDVGPGLAIFGGAVIEAPLDATRTRGLVFSLPWIAPLPFATAAAGSLKPLDTIPQQPAIGSSSVTVAAFDLAAAIPMVLDPAGWVALAIGRGSVPELEATLKAALGLDPLAPTGLDRLTPTNAVDRAFASNLPGAPAAWSSANALTTPIYWRCLLALARLWQDTAAAGTDTTLQVATLLGLPQRGQAWRLTLDLIGPRKEDVAKAPLADLLVLARNRVEVAALTALEATWVAAADGEALGRLAGAAWTLAPDPLVVCAGLAVGAGAPRRRHHQEFRPIDLPTRLDVVPARRALRRQADTVFASPGLGWPTCPRTTDRQTLSLGHESPLQDPIHGWAGRARTLGGHLTASAVESPNAVDPAELGGSAVFLALGRRVLFERIATTHHTETLIAPADRGLMPVAPRVRAPLASSIKAALDEVATKTAALAALLPGNYETVSTGVRPGVLVLEHEGLIAANPANPFDPEHARFGRPADRAPLVLHQGRAPRSTALPQVLDLAKSRRTFIGDNWTPSGQTHHRPFLLLRGPGSVLRYRPEAIDGTTTANKDDPTPATIAIAISVTSPGAGRLGPDFDGTIELRLDCPAGGVKADSLTLEAALARLGLLRDQGPRVTLSVGAAALSFSSASYRVDAKTRVTLTLKALLATELATLRAAIVAADADTEARLTLGLAAINTTTTTLPTAADFALAAAPADKLQAGPPVVISIPLPLVPAGRPWLPIETMTVAFGDPAYDRELGGPTAAAIEHQQDNTYLLALDRRDYDPGGLILFACGIVNPKFRQALPEGKPFNPGVPGAKWSLRIELIRAALSVGAKDAPPALALRVRGADSLEIDPGEPYSLPITALTTESGQSAQPAPGDRLTLIAAESTAKIALKVDVGIVKEPLLPPPAAVYGLVTLDGTGADMQATPALFAAAPLPTIVEYPDLLSDLVRGQVRRRGLFIWSFVPRRLPPDGLPPDGAPYAGLVKIDRTGGGQVPSEKGDFLELPAASS